MGRRRRLPPLVGVLMPADEFHEIDLRFQAIARWSEQAITVECSYIDAVDAIDKLTFTIRAMMNGLVT